MMISDFSDITLIASITNMGIIITGSLVTYLISRRKTLEQKGYPDAYIDFQQKFNRQFGISFIAFIIIVQVLSAITASSFIGHLNAKDYLDFIIIPTLMLALPFALIKTIQQNKEYKRLADENNLQIAVDFGFIKLKRMFDFRIELVSSLLILSYLLMYEELRNSLIIILYILLLWFFAAVVRFSRYSIKPVLKDQYQLFGKMLIIYQALLLLLLFVPRGLDNWTESGNAGKIMFIVVSASLAAKLILYITRYPGFRNELDKEP